MWLKRQLRKIGIISKRLLRLLGLILFWTIGMSLFTIFMYLSIVAIFQLGQINFIYGVVAFCFYITVMAGLLSGAFAQVLRGE